MEKVTCVNCEAETTVNCKFCNHCGYQLLKPIRTHKTLKVPKKNLKKKYTKKTIGASVLGIVLFLVLYYASFQFFSPTYDEALGKMADDMNKICPMMVDADTRLDDVGILPGNIIQYNYTLINMDQARVNTLDLRNSMEPFITNAVKTDPDMQFQRDNKTTLNYHYRDKNGSYLFLLSITPDKYL